MTRCFSWRSLRRVGSTDDARCLGGRRWPDGSGRRAGVVLLNTVDISTEAAVEQPSAGALMLPHKTRQQITQLLVKDTSDKLKQASEADHRVQATKKIAKDFQAVLKEFQKAQRLASSWIMRQLVEERDQGIQEIQHQITEVNEIFKDLAVLVHGQGAMIDDIDSHIDNAAASTMQAKGQLSKAAKNSSLICLLLSSS
uniref:t-SNARE coiled-coil homology domain-containing protein n=1 Tax=Zea mays TaxID=4577 RepID=A0A804MYP7_MAIZE